MTDAGQKPGESIPDTNQTSPSTKTGALDVTLGGSLPCVMCGYELRGLSISGVCPECGTAVRATILYKVDPQAEEFHPVYFRRLTAWCLVGWSLSAMLSVVVFWFLRADDLAAQLTGVKLQFGATGAVLALAFAAFSGLCLIPLIHPVRGTAKVKSALALVALAAYVPLLMLMARLLEFDQSSIRRPYFDSGIAPDRVMLRLGIGACVIVILLCFRPIARDLVRRSLALRTGRVDRQTILGMAAVLGLIMVGDLVALWGASMGPGKGAAQLIISTVIIAVGSSIVTLGFISALIDSWRIRRAILLPSPSLRQVIEGHPSSPSAKP